MRSCARGRRSWNGCRKSFGNIVRMRSLSKRDKDALAQRMGTFVQQYARKAQKGKEPNDRQYDRGIEEVIRKLKPEELDVLLNGEPDER